jgi:hypothetical protein
VTSTGGSTRPDINRQRLFSATMAEILSIVDSQRRVLPVGIVEGFVSADETGSRSTPV